MTAPKGKITIERCRDCARAWVLPRTRCAACGGVAIATELASGGGQVFSATLVHRAPNEALRVLIPYRIGLVDLDEGPRLMAHLADDAPIGARVEGAMETIAGETVPVFGRSRHEKGRTVR